ncbi:Tol-Pal system beta propeller repeat protein TolB [Phaeobacter sp. B1627]|uniref:Tol-Pal system beta propeller repeat protein TolB n=1 Tax=Phaeobacter sp. B1627 TaxID=2583809 RepID=UPI0011198376|nr:Tol-Pal system beta propeller repeat protein TolB [Phaeobacter sp. B1627]TNJ42031.1 Tol-Pal system protein TolB [Phaeobacter sp. B1627]
MRNALATLFLGLSMLLPIAGAPGQAQAQDGPLRIEITDGVIEPLPFATPDFIADTPAASQYAADIARVIASDLVGSGLFREIPKVAYISSYSDFDAAVNFTDWKAINAQALITGAVNVSGDRISVRFRAYDVFAGQELGSGLQLSGTAEGWRRIAHKVADTIYSRLTGEGGYFDSRVVFVSETGPKNDRKKRLAIMDYDGANVQYLTSSNDIVLAPRFSPTGDRVLYTSYESGFPQIHVLDVGKVQRRILSAGNGIMSFAPRFAPDGQTVVYSQSEGGNSDLYSMNINSGATQRLTSAPSIETAPSFSPDGSQIVFESDRSGASQLYIMAATGGEAKRISFGQGRYGTPVWSPRGDYIAFTKQNAGRFHIGVMRTDGSEERLLTASFLDEGPTWSPNGRVIMFTRETQGAAGQARLYSVDVSGRNLKPVKTPDGASDPSWSPLQK